VAELARWIGGADEEVAMAVEYATERQRSVQVGAFRLCPMRDGSVDVERVA
jgi:hypothetical protein